MKKMLLLFLTAALIFVFQCGGPKKLTPDEYAKLTPQEKIVYLQKQVDKNPQDIELKKQLYQEYLDQNMADQAIPVMEEIIKQDPYQPEVQMTYGKMMLERGESQAAYQAFRDALQSPGGTAYTEEVASQVGGRYTITQFTDTTADEAFPAFSGDGNSIAYQIFENDNWDIMQKDRVNGDSKLLVDTQADEELPSYSPDGLYLVYTSNADDRRPIDNKFKVREIYQKELETGFTKNLTETVADDWLPRYSHDGNYILFVSERSDLRSVPYTEKQSDIYVMESDGDFHVRLTNNEHNDGGSCFSADDQRVFFHSNRNGSYDIFMMKKDGTMPVTVLGDPVANEVNPFASPDSQYIVYFSDQGGNYDIYRARVDGTQPERLTFNPGKDTNPVYSPDGHYIAFQSDRNGNFDIYILDLEKTSAMTASEMVERLNQMIGG